MNKYSPAWEGWAGLIKKELKAEEKKYRESCKCREMKPKHKYIYILGRSKKETKELHNKFKELNPRMVNLPYPNKRGK